MIYYYLTTYFFNGQKNVQVGSGSPDPKEIVLNFSMISFRFPETVPVLVQADKE
jgi:hypothetical protein